MKVKVFKVVKSVILTLNDGIDEVESNVEVKLFIDEKEAKTKAIQMLRHEAVKRRLVSEDTIDYNNATGEWSVPVEFDWKEGYYEYEEDNLKFSCWDEEANGLKVEIEIIEDELEIK